MGKCQENGFSLGQEALGRAQDHGAEGGGDPQEELCEILLLSLLSFSNEENQLISLPGETEASQHPPGLAQVFPMNVHCAVAHSPSGHLQPQTSPCLQASTGPHGDPTASPQPQRPRCSVVCEPARQLGRAKAINRKSMEIKRAPSAAVHNSLPQTAFPALQGAAAQKGSRGEPRARAFGLLGAGTPAIEVCRGSAGHVSEAGR